jgi:hypothetical protein
VLLALDDGPLEEALEPEGFIETFAACAAGCLDRAREP